MPDECICHVGYAGENCEVGKLHISLQECSCTWYVMWCHSLLSSLTDLLRCQRDAPCQNGATCTNDGVGGYHCLCEPGWEGTDCDMEVNECAPGPCQNGGTCNVRT